MRTLRFQQFGSPDDVLEIQTLPRPKAQADEVVIEIYAAGINPSDVKNVQGMMSQTTLPRTPGRDFAGIVVDGPSEYLGTHVWGTGGDIGFTRNGSHTEYLVLPSTMVSEKPTNLSFEEAATVGVAFVTAWLALIESGRLTEQDVVTVVGANGAVGSAAIQIARWKGAFVIGTVRNQTSQQAVLQLGAHEVVDTSQHEIRKAIMDITDRKGSTLVFDTVGGNLFETSLSLLAQKGRLLEISATHERRVSFDLRDFYHREAHLIGVDSLQKDGNACRAILEQLKPGFECQAFKPMAISKRYPLEDALTAYRTVARGEGGGKVMFSLH
jgi:NADPH:quinone reductase